uniref:Splicing regulatory glutamine/lysine-rich protein 1 n=1 Tax=Apteryx owenii TaxID=8824 RepID=A0A8B9Q0U7_APTOW
MCCCFGFFFLFSFLVTILCFLAVCSDVRKTERQQSEIPPLPTPPLLILCMYSLGVSLGTLGAIPAAALDPNITALGEIPQPPIMGNVDPSKIDEIRRTVYVGNLNSQTTTADQLLEFFKQVGEVKFVRMAGDETQPTRFAFVEFADQNSVPRALAFNGVMFGDRPLKINHSNNAIVKPPEMTPQAAAKELEEVMKRVREAQSFISAAIEPGRFIISFKHRRRILKGKRDKEKVKEKEKTKEKEKERDRDKEKERDRDRDKERERDKERNRDKDKEKDRDKDKERNKDRDRVREKDRDRDREKEKDKDRDRDKEREKDKDRDKEKDREEDREKVKDKEGDKDKGGDKEKDRDKEKEKDGEKEREREKERDDRKKKEKRSKTPPRSYSSSRRSRSSSRFVIQNFWHDKDHTKEDPSAETDKEVGNREIQRTDEVKLQQNGNCQPNEENLSVKMEEV